MVSIIGPVTLLLPRSHHSEIVGHLGSPHESLLRPESKKPPLFIPSPVVQKGFPPIPFPAKGLHSVAKSEFSPPFLTQHVLIKLADLSSHFLMPELLSKPNTTLLTVFLAHLWVGN